MIGTLFGTVEEISKDHIIINVNDIGYIVYLSERSLENCQLNKAIKLYIYNHNNRDYSTTLYGFISKKEKDCMSMLIKVNGISCKTAITILSNLTPKEVISAICNSDRLTLKIGKLGPKLVSRIITELHSEAEKLNSDNHSLDIDQDSLSALVNLGYDKKKSYEIIKIIKTKFPNIGIKEVIYKALQMLT